MPAYALNGGGGPVRLTVSLVDGVREKVNRLGYCVLHGLDEQRLRDLAAALGEVTVDPRHPFPVRRIRPQELLQANPNTLSSRYGLGSFPFHTDVAHWYVPATIVLLLCLNPGSGGRPTLLTDCEEWDLDAGAMANLLSGVWRTGYRNPFLCQLLCMESGRRALRYDPGCMAPRSPSAVMAQAFLGNLPDRGTVTRLDWSIGTVLVLDNQRILHARGLPSRGDEDRCIARVLVGGRR
jgi:L-asparagine oxygenase